MILSISPGVLAADISQLRDPGHGARHLGYASADPEAFAQALLAGAAAAGWLTTFATEAHRGWPVTWHIDNDAELMRAAASLTEARSTVTGVLHLPGWAPARRDPVTAFVVGTADGGLNDPQIRVRAENVVQYGRKLGVALVVITPSPAVADLGHSLLIREAITWVTPAGPAG